MSSSAGTDENIQGSKIQPLDSKQKANVPTEHSEGVVGAEETINQARIDPEGGKGQYQHPLPRADDQGSVGRDGIINKVKIDPLRPEDGGVKRTTATDKQGIGDEAVDGARVAPMGEVRDELA